MVRETRPEAARGGLRYTTTVANAEMTAAAIQAITAEHTAARANDAIVGMKTSSAPSPIRMTTSGTIPSIVSTMARRADRTETRTAHACTRGYLGTPRFTAAIRPASSIHSQTCQLSAQVAGAAG